MPRLFVGIELPQPVKMQLTGLQGGLNGARWQTEAQLHLTVRFIGEVDGADANDVADGLSHIDFTPFEAAVVGLGSFGNDRALRTLWAGIEPEQPFQALHKKIDRALVSLGFEAEGRRYRPHVTLARFKSPPRAPEVERFLAAQGRLRSPHFTISQVCLFQSHLGHGGAHYTVVERYPAQ